MITDNMRSFDRPIRPEWIYKLHQLWEPNQLASSYNQPFTDIAWQVDGEDARRKARNLVFYYFISTEGRAASKRTLLKDTLVALSKQHILEEMKPLYLSVILGKSDIVQKITDVIAKRYQLNDIVEVAQISQLIKREYGDRDVIRRSVTSFCKTLCHFGIFETITAEDYSCYRFANRMSVSLEMTPLLLHQLFVIRLGRLQFEIQEIKEDSCWLYFDAPELWEKLLDFNNRYWTISRKVGFKRLTFLHDNWN